MTQELDTPAVAAKWWADFPRNRSATYDNGARDDGSIMAGAMQGMLADSKTVEDEQVDLFEHDLANFIRAWIAESNIPLRLAVDYGPESPLAEIVMRSNVPADLFPWKTSMLVTATSVKARAGYNATMEETYA